MEIINKLKLYLILLFSLQLVTNILIIILLRTIIFYVTGYLDSAVNAPSISADLTNDFRKSMTQAILGYILAMCLIIFVTGLIMLFPGDPPIPPIQ